MNPTFKIPIDLRTTEKTGMKSNTELKKIIKIANSACWSFIKKYPLPRSLEKEDLIQEVILYMLESEKPIHYQILIIPYILNQYSMKQSFGPSPSARQYFKKEGKFFNSGEIRLEDLSNGEEDLYWEEWLQPEEYAMHKGLNDILFDNKKVELCFNKLEKDLLNPTDALIIFRKKEQNYQIYYYLQKTRISIGIAPTLNEARQLKQNFIKKVMTILKTLNENEPNLQNPCR